MSMGKLPGLDRAPAPYFLKIKKTNKVFALGLVFHSQGLPVGMAAFTTKEKATAYGDATTADKTLVVDPVDVRYYTQDKLLTIAGWFKEYFKKSTGKSLTVEQVLMTHVIIDPDPEKAKEGYYDEFDKFDFPGVATWAVASRYATGMPPHETPGGPT